MQIPFKQYKFVATGKAQYYYSRVINIPCSTNLHKEDIDVVVDALTQFEKDNIMKKLVLIGGGGHCKVILDSLSKEEYDEIVITDNNFRKKKYIYNYKVVGDDSNFASSL